MANFEAVTKQDSQTGKWGYAYSYKVERKNIGGAGRSEYTYDSQDKAEDAIVDLKQELNAQIAKQIKASSKALIVKFVFFALAVIIMGYFSYRMVYPTGVEFGEIVVKSLLGQTQH